MAEPDVTVHEGFFPLVAQHSSSRLYLGVQAFETPFLISGGLETGVGVSEIPLDRGYPGRVRLARFVRIGPDIVLEYLASGFGNGRPAESPDPAQKAVDDSFARSVAYVNTAVDDELLAELSDAAPVPLPTAAAYVDITDFVTTDVHNFQAAIFPGLAPVGAPPGSIPYTPIREKSFAHTRQARSFSRNVELVATVSFAASGPPPEALSRVVPDPRYFTVTQRLSFLALPEGFTPRAYHPGSGGWRNTYQDPALIAEQTTEVSFQPRFRVARTPIVFSVDPGIPEPYRQAVLEGASWWADAFSAAGLTESYRVELLAAERDPWEIGTNPIWWVHRSGRGWSMGHSVSDPFTGEILRGSVRLGSQRVTQLRTLFEALLSPYGRSDESARLADIEQAIVSRIRQLAAHEVGHALGFQHNFASNDHPVPSVMDYPHASIDFDDDGELTLSNAYAGQLGPWDYFLVAHAYGEFGADEEQSSLASLRASVSELGYLNDPDGHSPRATSWRAVPWTLRHTGGISDSFHALAHILAVREKALSDFGPGVAPGSAPLGEVESRLGAVYLLHRFQVQAVVRYIGGVDYRYGQGADGVDLTTTAPALLQHRALDALSPLLSRQVLEIPSALIDRLTPPSIGYDRPPTVIGSRSGAVVDATAYVEAGASLVASEVLSPARLNRVYEQHEHDRRFPSIRRLIRTLFPGADSIASQSTVARYALHALASGQLTDAARLALDRALARQVRKDDLATAAFVRRGLDRIEAGRFDSDHEFRLPTIPGGVPL